MRSGGASSTSSPTARLADFDQPALVLWATEDKAMPPAHAGRLAATSPQSELVWIDDSYTLIALDQPAVLARAIRDFVGA